MRIGTNDVNEIIKEQLQKQYMVSSLLYPVRLSLVSSVVMGSSSIENSEYHNKMGQFSLVSCVVGLHSWASKAGFRKESAKASKGYGKV